MPYTLPAPSITKNSLAACALPPWPAPPTIGIETGDLADSGREEIRRPVAAENRRHVGGLAVRDAELS